MAHTVPPLETLAKIAEAMEFRWPIFHRHRPHARTKKNKQKMSGEISQDEIAFLAESRNKHHALEATSAWS